MLGLKQFLGDLDLATGSPLTLAAIGFVVLASFTVGELVAGLGLPKITGYIVSGIAFGPQVSNILSHRIVTDMKVFNTLALGLIALTAGLELDIKATRKVFGTLASTVAIKIPLLLVLVGGAFWLIETYRPSLGLPTPDAVIALAILFAVLAIGTSPSVSLAVVNDSRAKGRLTDLTLAMAVVKDLVVVVCLAVAVALAKGFLHPDARIDAHTFVHVATELCGSLLFGATLGALLIAYVRFVRKEMLLAMAAVVLLTAEAASALHLELLLVLIAAGFVVRNFSKFEHKLLLPLTRISLPVFIVFFTTAGAGVDLQGTLKILPLAAGLALARAIGFYIASALGTRFGNEPSRVRENAWLAYLPQAGVTLGLVLLAARQIPELSDAITSTGLAVISINLLVGPITLGLGLRRAGEIPGVRGTESTARAKSTPMNAAPVAGPPLHEPSLVQQPSAPLDPPTLPRDPALELALTSAHQAITEQLGAFWNSEVVTRWAETRLVARRALADNEKSKRASEGILRVLGTDTMSHAKDWESQLAQIERNLIGTLESYPESVAVPLTRQNFGPEASDFVETKVSKLIAHLLSQVWLYPRRRKVPVRLTLRYALERPVVEAVSIIGEALFEFELAVMQPLTALARAELDQDEALRQLDEIEKRFAARTLEATQRALLGGLSQGTWWLDRLGGPGHPSSELRLSTELPRIAAARRRRVSRLPRWQKLVAAQQDSVRLAAAVDLASVQFRAAVQRRCWTPLSLVATEIIPLLQGVVNTLASVRDESRTKTTTAADEVPPPTFDSILPNRDRNRLRGLKSKYRHGTQFSELLTDCFQIVERMPKELRSVKGADTETSTDPLDQRTETVELAQLVQEALIDRFVPRFAEALGPTSDLVAEIDDRIDAALAMAAYGMRAKDRSPEEIAGDVGNPDTLSRAYDQVKVIVDELVAAVAHSRTRLEQVSEETLSKQDTLFAASLGAKERLRASMGQTHEAARRAIATVGGRARQWMRHVLMSTLRLARRKNLPGWLFEGRPDNMDPSGIRRILNSSFKDPESLGLPASCRSGFSAEPIDDIRLVTARRGELDSLIAQLQKGRTEPFANILVTGSRGSGRTSAINVIELRLARYQVVRLDPRFHRRTDGLIAAVAAEFGCAPNLEDVLQTVKQRRAVILIDDLEHYVLPNEEGMRAVTAFVNLVVRSSPDAAWVVSVERTSCDFLHETLSLSHAFGRHFDLAPLSPEELQSCIEARARMAGLNMTFAPAGSRRALEERAKNDYYAALAQSTRGNLRHALLTHLRSLKVIGEDQLLVRGDTRAALPFLARLGTDAVACLGFFLSYGPLSAAELASLLLVDEVTASHHILPLRDAGILRAPEHEGGFWVPAHLDGPLQRGLEELGILVPGSRA